MLYGFEIFKAFRSTGFNEVLEVFPHAIVHEIARGAERKASKKGFRQQLEAMAVKTGWEPDELQRLLKSSVRGSNHDKLDAFMAAWVASLPANFRYAYGDPTNPDDAIWVPRV